MLRTAPAALGVALLLALAAPSVGPSQTAPERLAGLAPVASEGAVAYTLDRAHSQVGFRIRHMGVAYVPGRFDDFDGTITFDPENIAATQVSATVRMTSVNTSVEARDNHLRSADFFEVEAHPTMTFVSSGVQPTGPNTFRLTGNLTMKGVTRPVTLDATAAGPIVDPRAGSRVGFHAEGEIDRRDFGVTWGNDLPSGVPGVANVVRIVLDAEATPAS